ncbi:hypothetical protein J6590_002128 [Homalodisca vitripennis]|nr:hypothetical protein J6590_002128 [Homalodisca vitripennis]
MSTERERADCPFHYSNTRTICSWQEGPLHPHSFSPPRLITPLNSRREELVTTRAICSWQEGPLHRHSFSPPALIAPFKLTREELVANTNLKPPPAIKRHLPNSRLL